MTLSSNIVIFPSMRLGHSHRRFVFSSQGSCLPRDFIIPGQYVAPRAASSVSRSRAIRESKAPVWVLHQTPSLLIGVSFRAEGIELLWRIGSQPSIVIAVQCVGPVQR
ncbi:uncharacterized protein ARMOST_19458 [Armillaria ostoyae]|uniref:Uncharacterized protein n=1 Tax=Armillaria ostoyae TaxID=47428 RepID=A0A284S4P5_ARMOS|nr:uncharacterized protein ARMOST_19458 [Armillaria ostoyae]